MLAFQNELAGQVKNGEKDLEVLENHEKVRFFHHYDRRRLFIYVFMLFMLCLFMIV